LANQTPKRSLSHRFGFAVAGITLLALISIITAILVIAQAGAHAAAVNAAGSLRMEAYRVSTALLDIESRILVQGESINLADEAKKLEKLINRLTEQLQSPQLYEVRKASPDTKLGAKYRRVENEWKHEITPMISQLLGFQPDSPEYRQLSNRYLNKVNQFVDHIDAFVLTLQDDSKSKIQTLGLLTLFCVFCTVGIGYGVMYLLNASVLIPLADLVELANQFKQGNFKARATNTSGDELGILAQTYNQMAASISRQYERLEQTVAEKTGELTRSNLTLEFLYNTSRQLTSSSDQDTLSTIVEALREVGELKYVLLCTKPAGQHNYDQLIQFGHSELIDTHRLKDDPVLLESLLHAPQADKPATVSALVEGQRHYGYLYAETDHLHQLNDWKKQLMQSVADQVAAAFSLQHQNDQERLLMLLEERTVIARELHDSLAQSLSYLKMQIARLKTLLNRNAEQQVIINVSNELQDGLNSAYRNLRELLNTFRLKITHPSLQAALEATVEEFRQFSGVPIELHSPGLSGKLTPNEDIHVLQVVREAVSNAVKHAAPQRVVIDCQETAYGEVTFAILDDGVGIPEDAARKHHYGLSIMQERAKHLQGSVTFTRRLEGGTRVALTFIPQNSQQPRLQDT